MLWSVLLDSVINDLNNGTECTFGKCVGDVNLGAVVDTLHRGTLIGCRNGLTEAS